MLTIENSDLYALHYANEQIVRVRLSKTLFPAFDQFRVLLL